MPTLLVLTALLAALPPSRAWYHPPSHPVYALFARDAAAPGSPQWAAQYPAAVRPPIPEALTPPAWLAALQAAEQAARIPNITIPLPTGDNPQYAPTDNPSGPTICSSTWGCRAPDDIWDAPSGYVAIGFDDGPTDGSAKLYQFLEQQNQSATHFMIGVNILQNYPLFQQAFNLQHDIAVHTWTHPYTTTLNNTQVLAQLGWAMQIIYDATGHVPRFWRAPYGDADTRVRAIAREVFALTMVAWNHDSADWSISVGRTTLPRVEAALTAWYTGPKAPGLNILEHELTDGTARAFIDTYPAIRANGWKAVSAAQLFGGAYRAGGVVAGANGTPSASASASGTPSASSVGVIASASAGGAGAGGASAAPASLPPQGTATTTSASANGAARARVARVSRTLCALAAALVLVLR